MLRLPGHEGVQSAAASVCPTAAPVKMFAVSAVETPLPMLTDATGRIYVLREDRDAVLSGSLAPSPLVLHVNVGDCIQVRLTSETQAGMVSFHADMLAFDPRDSSGVAAGRNPEQAVPLGLSRTYTYFAHPDVGPTTALVRDWGNVL